MAVRLTWISQSSGHDGFKVYMGEINDDLGEILDVGPEIEEVLIDTPVVPEACFAVASYSGIELGPQAELCAQTVAAEDFSAATIGDEIGGGIYTGIDTIDGADYHIISGKAESELAPEDGNTQWKTQRSWTDGTDSATDGLANTLAMEAAGLSLHPAAAHCLAYTGGGHNDWHMPARSQLLLMYNNLAAHPEFAANVNSGEYTWTSTQRSTHNAWIRGFFDGIEYDNGRKTVTIQRVRPVRRVPV